MELKVKRLVPEAKLPTKGHPDDAGIDLYTLEEVTFLPHAQMRVRTGIAVEDTGGACRAHLG